MSISSKTLEKLRKELGRGAYKKIADKLTCTPDWVGQVLRDPELAEKHTHVLEAAVEVVKEKKQYTKAISFKILEAVK